MPHVGRPCTPSSSLVVRAIEEHLGNNWVPTDWQHKQGKGGFRCKQRRPCLTKLSHRREFDPVEWMALSLGRWNEKKWSRIAGVAYS